MAIRSTSVSVSGEPSVAETDGDDNDVVAVLGSEAISQNMIRPSTRAVTTTMCFSLSAFT